jgi:hypothetical protein
MAEVNNFKRKERQKDGKTERKKERQKGEKKERKKSSPWYT